MSAHESASQHVEWLTPASLFAELLPGVVFDLDPAACLTAPSNVPLARGYTQLDTGGADHAWPIDQLVWLNPPYGRAGYQFLARMLQHALSGGSGVALLPVRTDTAWWHQSIGQLANWHPDLRLVFLRGRVSFVDSRTGSPAGSPAFPSCLVFWGEWPAEKILQAALGGQLLQDAWHPSRQREDHDMTASELDIRRAYHDPLQVGEDARALMGKGWRVFTSLVGLLPVLRFERTSND